MPKEKMLWSLNKLSSVRSSKMRSFTIMEWNTFEGNKFRLIGMFSKTDSFEFGIFKKEKDARVFLEEIHNRIEGGK